MVITSQAQPLPNRFTPAAFELFLEGVEAAEGLVDGIGKRAGRLAALVRAHDLPEHGVVHVPAAVVADRRADVLRQRCSDCASSLQRSCFAVGMFLDRRVQLGDVRRMVLVVVDLHRLLVDVRLQRVVRVWQRRDLMCRYSSLCHFNHLSFMNTGFSYFG